MAHTAARRIGTAEVTILTDGGISFSPEMFPGTDAAHIGALVERSGASEIATNFNAVLIRDGETTILADAGPRDLFGPTCGNLPAALAEAGASADEVQILFATHLHPDHVAGMIRADGTTAFANAELCLTEAEHDFWADPANVAGKGETLEGWAALARAVLAAYADRLRLIPANGQIAPGLSAVALPGHTPGHSGWRLSSGGEQLIHVGDIVHAPSVQVADPEIAIVFDLDMDTARATRKRLLDELASDGAMFTGGHFLRPAFHRVTRHGHGYRLEHP